MFVPASTPEQAAALKERTIALVVAALSEFLDGEWNLDIEHELEDVTSSEDTVARRRRGKRLVIRAGK